jgi:hypothetical protein
MAIYRVFVLGSDDHIIGADVIDCPTDREAMTLAPSIGGDHKAVEVWELARRVGRVDRPHAAESEQMLYQS